MARVTVYRFRVYDVLSDQMRLSRRMATRESINGIARGEVLEKTAVEVEDSAVGTEIPGMTAIDFRPPAIGPATFQTHVR